MASENRLQENGRSLVPLSLQLSHLTADISMSSNVQGPLLN